MKYGRKPITRPQVFRGLYQPLSLQRIGWSEEWSWPFCKKGIKKICAVVIDKGFVTSAASSSSVAINVSVSAKDVWQTLGMLLSWLWHIIDSIKVQFELISCHFVDMCWLIMCEYDQDHSSLGSAERLCDALPISSREGLYQSWENCT